MTDKEKAISLARLAKWDALSAGATVRVGNNTVVVQRKNTYSFTDTMGIRWPISEITGLSRSRIAAIRAWNVPTGTEGN